MIAIPSSFFIVVQGAFPPLHFSNKLAHKVASQTNVKHSSLVRQSEVCCKSNWIATNSPRQLCKRVCHQVCCKNMLVETDLKVRLHVFLPELISNLTLLTSLVATAMYNLNCSAIKNVQLMQGYINRHLFHINRKSGLESAEVVDGAVGKGLFTPVKKRTFLRLFDSLLL
jgi:hypothetical protein